MPNRLTKFLFVGLLLYWVAMFVATHIPGDAMPKQSVGLDKVAHFTAYAALACLAAVLLRAAGWWNWQTAIALVVAAAFYGAMDEWLQPYFHRDANLADWLADMAGAAFGLLALRFLQPLASRLGSGRRKTSEPRPPAAF